MPEETWAAWNAVFDRLDNDGDNVMSPSELRPFQCWGEINMLGMIIGQLKGHELVQPKPNEWISVPFHLETLRRRDVRLCLFALCA